MNDRPREKKIHKSLIYRCPFSVDSQTMSRGWFSIHSQVIGIQRPVSNRFMNHIGHTDLFPIESQIIYIQRAVSSQFRNHRYTEASF